MRKLFFLCQYSTRRNREGVDEQIHDCSATEHKTSASKRGYAAC